MAIDETLRSHENGERLWEVNCSDGKKDVEDRVVHVDEGRGIQRWLYDGQFPREEN